MLREARLRRGLTQQALAARLGLGQRQISDLERATKDPRLSTVQNVARALDLEVTIVPRHLIAAVEGLHRAGATSDSRPMYALDEDEAESDPDEPRAEIGGASNRPGQARPRRSRRGRR